MQSIMKTHSKGTGALHAPNLDRHNAATACGIVGGTWVNTKGAVTCQTCIRIMAAQVSKGVPYYRDLLKVALDSEFIDDVDGTSDRTHSEMEPTTLDICERGITLSIPYNDGAVSAYTINWKELIGMRDIVNTSAGGVNKISIVTEAGVYDGQ